MTALVLSAACPPVSVFSNTILLNTTDDTTARVAKNIAAIVGWRKAANQNAALLDLTARGGAGIIGVFDGVEKISLSFAITGLLLQISKGHAMIGGPVEIPAATTMVVPDATPRIWVWLLQSGALTYTVTTTPPAGEVCLLGNCTTSGGNIVSVDTSGVMYLRGGTGWRQTADIGPPTDTPPASVVFLSQTATGTYLWCGGWQAVGGSGGLPVDTVADGGFSLVASGAQEMIMDSLTVYGTLQDFGKIRVV